MRRPEIHGAKWSASPSGQDTRGRGIGQSLYGIFCCGIGIPFESGRKNATLSTSLPETSRRKRSKKPAARQRHN